MTGHEIQVGQRRKQGQGENGAVKRLEVSVRLKSICIGKKRYMTMKKSQKEECYCLRCLRWRFSE